VGVIDSKLEKRVKAWHGDRQARAYGIVMEIGIHSSAKSDKSVENINTKCKK